MSHDDPPPDPETGDPPADAGGERPWSPYPDEWDTFTSQPQPAAHYGGAWAHAAEEPGSAAAANPYGGVPASTPPFAFGGYASWLSRVGASLIDSILGSIAALPAWLADALMFSNVTTTTDSNGVDHLHVDQTALTLALTLIGGLTSLAFFIWNVCVRQGRTGASIGKSVLGLRLVDEDLQPIGAGRAFLRNLLHVVDALPCGFGYLWPIWDSRRQTFADKIMGTVVVNASQPVPPV
jgi:uncharacterized RDD family membrane protein YckC